MQSSVYVWQFTCHQPIISGDESNMAKSDVTTLILYSKHPIHYNLDSYHPIWFIKPIYHPYLH